MSLQGGDVETQRQLLEKDKELFQKTKEIASLERALSEAKSHSPILEQEAEFEEILNSGRVVNFIEDKDQLLTTSEVDQRSLNDVPEAVAFGLITTKSGYISLTDKGREFFKWYILYKEATS